MDVRVGTLANYTPGQLADRAASRLVDLKEPHAVCIDPRGVVTIEPYERSVFEDVVGVYSGDVGLLALYRDIREDLVFAVQERALRGDRSHRRGDWAVRRRVG